MELSNLRMEIDSVDNQLLDLLERRFGLIEQVAEYKREHDLPVFVPDRERAVLERLTKHANGLSEGGIRLLYGIIMDLNKLNEYMIAPKALEVPTGMGGASVRAILSNEPAALCRYLSALAAAQVSITSINSRSMPGGKLVVDLEVAGDIEDPNFMASLAVLSDTAEQFILL